MPEINIDTERAAAYIRLIGREAAADDAQQEKKTDDVEAAAIAVDQDAESWMTASAWAVDFLDKKFCPAWELDAGERDQLGKGLADVLDLYFPGAMRGFDNWHPLARLAGSVVMISAMRIDFETWRLAALHKAEKADHESTPRRRTLDLGDGDDPKREDVGRFTTHGE